MNQEELDERIAELLDAETARHAEGAKAREIQDAISPDVVALLDLLDHDRAAEAEAMIRRVANATRRSRRQNLRANVEYLVDAFTEDGAYMDPLLDLAYPVGTADGLTKTLRYWTEEDFHTSVRMTYRKAAEAAEAARRWDAAAERAIEWMRGHGRERFGDNGPH